MENTLKIIGTHRFTKRHALTGEILDCRIVKNIVVRAGRTVIAQRLAGTTTYSLTVNYGALGSSSTTPASTDTQLGSELASGRVAVTSQTYVNNIAYLSFFFPAGTSLTYAEFGNFIDGTASPNTGQLFTHTLMSG